MHCVDFFHTLLVGEISAKYSRTSAPDYLMNIWSSSLAQGKGVKLSVGRIQCIYTKGSKANCKINKKWKNDEFCNIAPQIFVNVYGHWFHCVALCELVWLHCMDFFILDFLERYRQNTAELSPPPAPQQDLIYRGLIEVQDPQSTYLGR